MRFLDSSALVDLLQDRADHHDDVVAYVEENEGRSFAAPTLVLYEIYRYAVRAGGADQLAETEEGLDWVEPVPFTHAGAREAALIEAELEDAETPINRMDVSIAAVVQEANGTLVTRDEDFVAVEGLEVERYV